MQRVDKEPKDNLIKLRYQSPKDDATSSSQTIYSNKASGERLSTGLIVSSLDCLASSRLYYPYFSALIKPC